MSIISDVGSSEYYELRAIEEIHTARSIRSVIGNGFCDIEMPQYSQHINKAIQLLLLARLSV